MEGLNNYCSTSRVKLAQINCKLIGFEKLDIFWLDQFYTFLTSFFSLGHMRETNKLHHFIRAVKLVISIQNNLAFVQFEA